MRLNFSIDRQMSVVLLNAEKGHCLLKVLRCASRRIVCPRKELNYGLPQLRPFIDEKVYSKARLCLATAGMRTLSSV